jgi:hypothetical protein
MTADREDTDSEVRWAALAERETLAELPEVEREELARLSLETEARRVERLVLAEVGKSAPLDPEGSAHDERLILAALAEHDHRRHRRRVFVWLSAAALLIPLAAAAAYLPRLMTDERPEAPVSGPAPAATPSVFAPEPPSPEREPAGTAKDEQPTAPSPRASVASSAIRAAPSAAELLDQAQQARSARNYAAAVLAYQQLLRLHPKSGVAPLARISLAQLQLAQGDPSAALAGFEAHEQTGGALSQEAHDGKIRALRALGRAAEERAESERFIGRYPKSPQAAALRERLRAADADP